MTKYYSDGEEWSPAEDESNMMYIVRNDKVYNKMIANTDLRSAFSEGYRYTVDGALRHHGIIESKFKPGTYVQKQGSKWVPVSPFAESN